MNIINTNQLDKNQIDQLKKLQEQCKKPDVSTPNLYYHILEQPRTFPASFLYYQEKTLIGFLAAYFFYGDAVEISLIVNPIFRRKGIAKKLIQCILPLIQSQNYSRLIFSSPAQLNSNWLIEHDFKYLHSEYYMEREDLNPLPEHQYSLSFRLANTDDIPLLCMIDDACFTHKQINAVERFQHIINGREHQIILAYAKDTLVGKAHIRWQTQEATLSDIAIIPAQQGKGLGTALITHCINNALNEGKSVLNLDVETHNKRALDLYIRLGFLSKNACEYWAIDIEKLH